MPPLAILALLAVLFLIGRSTVGNLSTGTMRTSNAGRQEIIRHEGIRYEAYRDSAGRWTIGVGHLVIPGDGLARDANGVPLPIDEAEVIRLFETDLTNAENAVRKHVSVPLTQGQFDALADFVYQFGAGTFASSTLLKFLNSGNYPGAANEFKRWIYVTNPATGIKEPSNGLIARRDDNFRMWLA
jgi:lysozyme